MLVRSTLLVSILCGLQPVFAQLKLTIPRLNETFVAGSVCNIAWVPDSSGNWRSMTIDLLSGPNNNMSFVQNVVSGLDGTTGIHTWTCPEVDPCSTTYIYQFTNGDETTTRAWTAHFTIIPFLNTTESPKNTRQPNGDLAPWGIIPSVCRSLVTDDWGSFDTQKTSAIPRADKGRSRLVLISDLGADPARSDRGEDSGEGTYQTATKPKIHPANISAARSAAARASAIVHRHDSTSNHDLDFSSGLSGSGDPDSDSQVSYLNVDDPDPGSGPSVAAPGKTGKDLIPPVMVSAPGHLTKSDASLPAFGLFPVLFMSTFTALAVVIM
ncbi:hypothetical protein M0805_007330 [Coniferiporia weirii]|nr:hypothetical protein M0805_007330 [Coniferiporia weirii]